MLELTVHPQGLAVQPLENGGKLISFQNQFGVIVNIPLTEDGVLQLTTALMGAQIQVAGSNSLHLAKK